MKLRSLYILSIVGLFLVVVIQLGGMMYAYDSYKKEAKRTLDECFRQAFIETVDNQINNLPFPDYTIPFYSYIPKDENRPMDNEVFLGYQQAASFLQDVYQVTIPLDEMERTLEKKLKWKNIDRTVWIDAAEDHSQYSAYRRFRKNRIALVFRMLILKWHSLFYDFKLFLTISSGGKRALSQGE